jgi:isopenicillin-N N-acyltransferase like protein
MYPRIQVEGSPQERGQQYGEVARDRVRRSIDAYREVFDHYTGWNWERVRREAARFRAPIEGYDRRYFDEMTGIAEGAGVDDVDVLAINVRTEIMFAATARQAAAATGPDADAVRRLPSECSAFAVLPMRTDSGRILVGQNWDWLPHSAETTVVLEVRQADRPDFVTVVEAGLLAKFGLNSSGVALLTNALVTGADTGEAGVPFHVLLRAILDSETISDALSALGRARRASSANYLIADEDGVAIDVEAAPGDASALYLGYPDNDVLLHTNHFVNGFDGRELSILAMPDSPVRLERLRQLFAERAGPVDVSFLEAVLADHVTYPLGVCCHPDPRLPEPDQSLTLAAAVVDVRRRTLWLASGNPCETAFEELDYSGFLAKPSPLRGSVAGPA